MRDKSLETSPVSPEPRRGIGLSCEDSTHPRPCTSAGLQDDATYDYHSLVVYPNMNELQSRSEPPSEPANKMTFPPKICPKAGLAFCRSDIQEALMAQSLVRAAQYLRVSTDHQQYSLDNQADAIARYAAEHGFQIVKTYCDAARSGLHLKNRPSLKQLLTDVVAGDLEFRAILVYDVSRWGRFQDIDEAAYYEYRCKSAGVPILYCAEPFADQNSTAELILKALKRAMAGEYSRELSAKVKAGQLRLTRLGYKMG